MKSKHLWFIVSLLVVTVLLFAILVPHVPSPPPIAITAPASMHASQTVRALHAYSHSETGPRNFPDNLHQLEEALDVNYDITKYRDPESGVYYEWLYYGRDVSPLEDDQFYPNSNILIAVPTLFNSEGLYPEEGEEGMRIVVYINGRTEVIPEQEFIQRIKQQMFER